MTLRRMKTYTGEQGYVYQYYFVGKRAASQENPATEYIFDVTSDRKTTYSVSVFLGEDVLKGWATVHGRKLNDAEQYGGAKMGLFRAFDEIEDMMGKGRRLEVDIVQLEEVMRRLGVE
jgi:hypothetical protein